jgi:hypothetical protein
MSETGTIALTADQFQATIAAAVTAATAAAGKPNLDDQIALIKLQAEENAKASQKLLRPENPTHPGISVYSRPGGDVANPKPAFRAKQVQWGGTDVFHGTSTAEEVELLNQLRPGAFTCRRADGTRFPVAVVQTADEVTGEVARLEVRFVTKGDAKNGLMPLTEMCRELIAHAAAPVKVA